MRDGRDGLARVARLLQHGTGCPQAGVPQRFLDHASRAEVLGEVGLTDQNVARQVTGWVAALSARDDSMAQQVD